jgi:diadenosine tetraphosphatase ApaH/serine/threonine PP2A family protein phosphatase
MNAMASCLILICKHIQDLLKLESRLLRIPAPCYILGDIHGNFHDLICFEKTLWRMGPMLTPASFLFLGDYVDRGSEGIEVVSYLFAQKLLSPSKFFLLRGNHELRNIQKMFHFHNECKKKFGENLGDQVWQEINNAFDCMPLAAVVDEKIFCLHGGIPSSLNGDNTLDDINKIVCPLRDPENESPLGWELLWNDPLSPTYDYDEDELERNKGFVHNTRRGTACFFSNEALIDFLKKNNLSYVVRAHEVQQVGFKVQLGGRLLTVFSSSHYCGGSNEAATVLVDSKKLRLIRLDTMTN